MAATSPTSTPLYRTRAFVLLGMGALVVVGAVLGWQLFFFITDDAYLAFRYVSNSLAGRGLVWNPAPFKPVEGYTSFLWVIILREVWRLTGMEPPDSSNVLSLLCGLGTLWLTARFVLRMVLPPKIERLRLVLLALVLLGTLTNRTFLAWLSSGLETALFNLLVTWWVYEGTAPTGRDRPAWILRLSLSATLCALCRPDGLLAVGATVLMLALERPRRVGLTLVSASPLLAIPGHLIWRRLTYEDWLPNTYRAKYIAAWPASGLRYLASFVVEYGLWWWVLLAILAAAVRIRRGEWRLPGRQDLGRAIPIAVLLFHVSYYTLMIGGDHFEYRVYSELIPLIFVSAVSLAVAATSRASIVVSLVSFLLLASWPIPWVHWLRTKDLDTRETTYQLRMPVADAFPWPLRPVVAQWDSWQDWLILHYVCMRHQEHKIFSQYQFARLPSRREASQIPWGDHDVFAGGTLGVPGWVAPNVAMIDMYGLNDRIIARRPYRPAPGEEQLMAHSRTAPPGYVECFHPNVFMLGGTLKVVPRRAPLTEDEIRACESTNWP